MKRKNWTHLEKFKVVLEVLQGHRIVAEICNDYGIHQSQYYKWREIFLREGSKVFQSNDATRKESVSGEVLDVVATAKLLLESRRARHFVPKTP